MNNLVALLSLVVMVSGSSSLCAMKKGAECGNLTSENFRTKENCDKDGRRWKFLTSESVRESVSREEEKLAASRWKEFECSQCKKVFDQEYALNSHLSSQHHACFTCLKLRVGSEMFPSVSALIEHCIDNTETHPRYHCQHCLNYICLVELQRKKHEFSCPSNPKRIAEKQAESIKDNRLTGVSKNKFVPFRNEDTKRNKAPQVQAVVTSDKNFTPSSISSIASKSASRTYSRFEDKLRINPSYYPVQINPDNITQMCDLAPITRLDISLGYSQMSVNDTTQLCDVAITAPMRLPTPDDFDVKYMCNNCHKSFNVEFEAQVHTYNRECLLD